MPDRGALPTRRYGLRDTFWMVVHAWAHPSPSRHAWRALTGRCVYCGKADCAD